MMPSDAVQTLQSFSNAVAKLADMVSPSVVNVNSGRRTGSGIVWTKDGHIVTANHVLGHSTEVGVTTSDGRELQAKVVGRDHYTDIALLKVEAEGLVPLDVHDGKEVRVGQFVLAMANAFGTKPSATSGIVTSQGRTLRGFWGSMIEEALITDARLNPGYSGGPLVDAAGRLMGMNVAYFSGRGVAVPVTALSDTVEKLRKDGRIRTGHLGVVIDPFELPSDISKKPDVGQEIGLLVREVEEASPAKESGVSVGDIILRLGDAKADGEFGLRRALSGEAIGRESTLYVLRGGQVVSLKVVPSESEE